MATIGTEEPDGRGLPALVNTFANALNEDSPTAHDPYPAAVLSADSVCIQSIQFGKRI